MNEKIVEKFGLSSYALKIIALVTMVCDHAGFMFFQNQKIIFSILRIIGRISFPLFCFLLVEGFYHTRDRRKYTMRLLIFALISEIPYDRLRGTFFDINRQNVMFTLLLGFLVIWAMHEIKNNRIKYPQLILNYLPLKFLNTVLVFVIITLSLICADKCNLMYSYTGIALIIMFYVFHDNYEGHLISNLIFNWGFYDFSEQWFGVLSAIPIALYNGEPGKKGHKYFFYIFYPAHFIVLMAVRYIINRIM